MSKLCSIMSPLTSLIFFNCSGWSCRTRSNTFESNKHVLNYASIGNWFSCNLQCHQYNFGSAGMHPL
jgi:hypothetical protein